jgi:alpha-N-acetylglucosaminidase
VENSSIIAARPALLVKKSGPNAGFNIPYPPMDLVQTMELFLQESARGDLSDGYRYDIIDINRQIFSNLGQLMHQKAVKAFKAKSRSEFDLHSKRFLSLLKDLDDLLGTRKDFSFDHWIESAGAQATTDEEKRLYEYNATLLLTWWGGDKDPTIFDYARREWSGLIRGYYLPRWEEFYSMLDKHLQNGSTYSEDNLPQVYGRETLRANQFYNELADLEQNWIISEKKLNRIDTGAELKIVKRLLTKYKPLYNEYYGK